MNARLDTLSLLILLPQVAVLAVFPLVLHGMLSRQHDEAGSQDEGRRMLARWGGRRIAGVAGLLFLALLVMCGGLSWPAFAIAFSPHTEERLYDRLLWPAFNPIYIAAMLAIIALVPLLAKRGIGIGGTRTIGFWIFVIAALFPAYWLGLGGMSPDLQQDWRIVASAAAVGALAAVILAQVPLSALSRSRTSHEMMPALSNSRWQELIMWVGAGAFMPVAGALLGWAVGRAVAWNESWRTPFEGDLSATLLVLIVALAVGLALGALTGVLTGLLTGKARWTLLPAIALVPLSLLLIGQAGPQDARPFKVLEAEGGYVESLAFTPDGSLLAAGLGPDVVEQEKRGALIVWRTSDWSVLKSFTVEAGTPDIAFAPDGQTLAVGSAGGSVQLYRVSDWTLVRNLTVEGRGVGVAFSPDGKTLAGAAGTKIWLWSTQDWALTRTLQIAEMSKGSCVAFSPDGQYIATGSSDWKVQLWRVSDGSLALTMSGHTREITALAFSADGQSLASTSWDDTVRIWSVSDGQLLRNLDLASTAVAFSPDSRKVTAGAPWSVPQLWRVLDGVLLSSLLNEPSDDGINSKTFSIAFSPDGRIIAGGSQYQEVRLWSVPR